MTTAIEVLNPGRDRHELRERLGVQLQAAELPARLQVGEALRLYSSFYAAPADWRALVEMLGLSGQQKTQSGQLSGGQRQRLSIALALVGQPEVVVLDELTTGLDPQARRDTWTLIEGVRDRGTTVVLVTHFMEEAERLCDRIAVFDSGRIVALDTPAALAAGADAGQRIMFRPDRPLDEAELLALPEVCGVQRRGATPVGAVRVLAAQLIVDAGMAAVTMIALLVVARLAFGVAFPRQPAEFALAVVLGGLALLSLGLLLASVLPTSRGANAAGAILFFPMMFFAGLWLPVAAMPSALRHVSQATPLGAAVQAMTDAWQGHWHPLYLLILAGYAVAFAVAAAILFRWD
jgi:energy-coupling factor transporter ATP-binding protein EcfA2